MKINSLTEKEQLMWFVGIFEGEGCIKINKKSNGGCLIIRSTDKDVIEKIKEIMGGYMNGPIVQKEGYKPQWEWALHKNDEVNKLLSKILPYLSNRRKNKAIELLDKPIIDNRVYGNKQFDEVDIRKQILAYMASGRSLTKQEYNVWARESKIRPCYDTVRKELGEIRTWQFQVL